MAYTAKQRSDGGQAGRGSGMDENPNRWVSYGKQPAPPGWKPPTHEPKKDDTIGDRFDDFLGLLLDDALSISDATGGVWEMLETFGLGGIPLVKPKDLKFGHQDEGA